MNLFKSSRLIHFVSIIFVIQLNQALPANSQVKWTSKLDPIRNTLTFTIRKECLDLFSEDDVNSCMNVLIRFHEDEKNAEFSKINDRYLSQSLKEIQYFYELLDDPCYPLEEVIEGLEAIKENIKQISLPQNEESEYLDFENDPWAAQHMCIERIDSHLLDSLKNLDENDPFFIQRVIQWVIKEYVAYNEKMREFIFDAVIDNKEWSFNDEFKKIVTIRDQDKKFLSFSEWITEENDLISQELRALIGIDNQQQLRLDLILNYATI